MSTFPGPVPAPSTLTKAYRESGDTATPWVEAVDDEVLLNASPLSSSKNCTAASCFNVATSSRPSGEAARW